MTTTAIPKDQSISKKTVNHSAEMQPKAVVNNLKPAQRHRIPVPQRIRVMQLYALGRNQTQIAREERLNREAVHKIVSSSEMNDYVEHMRTQFRGLCDLAMEALRQELREHGKEAVEIAFRVLEANGVIPPKGQVVNQIAQDALTEDESVQKTLSAFGRIAMERARAFNTPFPELEEAAEQAGVKFNEE